MRVTEPTLEHPVRSPWAMLVTASACVVLAVAIATGVWWAASSERRVTSYDVRGPLTAISLDLDGSDAQIVGGRDEPVVQVRHEAAFAFGHPPATERDVTAGTLRIRARCPASVLGTCSARYRLTVPDNVPVTVRTGTGDVQVDAFRGRARIETGTGDITATGYCGFLLQARADSGDVSASASCAPERLELRARTGSVRALVPPGRYRIDADSEDGKRAIRGLTAADDAPFRIQALSTSGDVGVEAGP